MISSLMNMPVPPNTAIVGRNAFARITDAKSAGVLVTGGEAASAELAALADLGIRIIVS